MPKEWELQNRWQLIGSVLAAISWIPIGTAAVVAHRPVEIQTAPIAVLWSIGIALQLCAGVVHIVQFFRNAGPGSQSPTVVSTR